MSAAELWAKGNYGEIARQLEPAAQALVEAATVVADERVLDVGAGDGNLAIAAARRGAHVVAVDISPQLVARGRSRTAGLDIDWVEGDALGLPFPDGTFDAALSAFGVVYAPEPDRAAAEQFRVVRGGGVVGLTAWTPESFSGLASEAIARHAQIVEGHRPDSWGNEEIARQRLGTHGEVSTLERRVIRRQFASVDAWWKHADRFAPPLAALREAVDPHVYERLHVDLVELAQHFARPVPEGVELQQEYLLAIARKP
ncbi:MAG: methyltransferase domain-containing protein [Actinobacteria bacterium]|nr:methyltransferase domain-containing protein [Actinomycetota bacterium]